MIAVTFALPAESSDFVRQLKNANLNSREGLETVRGQMHGRTVAVLHTGVGAKSCRQKIEKFLRRESIDYLISTGFAGALSPDLQVGDLLLSENFSSPELLQSAHLVLASEAPFVGKLVTVPELIDSKRDRERLAMESGAAGVDMETEWIVQACAAHRVRLLSLRAITDTPAEPFPAPPGVLFDLEKQRTSLARLALYLATHPGALKRLNSFRRRVAMARRALTMALDKLLQTGLA